MELYNIIFISCGRSCLSLFRIPIMELYNIIFISCGRRCLSLFRIPIDFDILFDILSQWLFQLNVSFRIKPRKLKSCTILITVLLIYKIGGTIIFCFVWNTVYLVFEIFKDSLFTLSHSLILDSSVLILSSIFSCGRFGVEARNIYWWHYTIK